jgi:putative addiction module component (TIGR02574 family)
MLPTVDTLLAEAAKLPASDRIALFDGIWSTLAEDELPPISEEWLAEIQRRSEAYDAGETTTRSWEEVYQESLAKLSQRKR